MQKINQYWTDVIPAIALAALALSASLWLQGHLPDRLIQYHYEQKSWYDAWFSGDSPRIYAEMTDRSGARDYHSIATHPIFQLAVYPPAKVLIFLGFSPLGAVRFLTACIAGLWAATFFTVMRLFDVKRWDAALFTTLAMVSAASMFWFAVPETWGLSSLSLLLTLIPLGIKRHRPIHPVWQVLSGAFALGITLTNGMIASAIAFVTGGLRKAIIYTAVSIAIVGLLCIAQAPLFPDSRLTIPNYQKDYFFEKESGGPGKILTVIFLHAVVMPKISLASKNKTHNRDQGLTVQHSSMGFHPAVWLWITLLALGIMSSLKDTRINTLSAVLWIFLSGQIVLHLVYGGEETFLYALDWTPFLVLLAAQSTFTRYRRVALGLAAALVVCGGINNYRLFNQAVEMISDQSLKRYGHATMRRPLTLYYYLT